MQNFKDMSDAVGTNKLICYPTHSVRTSPNTDLDNLETKDVKTTA